jgi:hypothetical protein
MTVYVVLLYNEIISGIYSSPEKAQVRYDQLKKIYPGVSEEPNDYDLTLAIVEYQLDEDEE